MNYLLKNVLFTDPEGPAEAKPQALDVYIAKGRIAEIGQDLKGEEATVMDAKGLRLMPGFIDLHTHFREPGYESKETIQTGAHAALRGGYVASVSMPNTNPPCDHQSVIDNIIRKAKEVPYTIFPAGTISKGREGKELSEMADLVDAGIVAVTDDHTWVANAILMRRAMEYASMFGLIVMSHCEDKNLSAEGVMNEGFASTRLGLRGIPAASEDVAVARDIELARLTGAKLHLSHISTARSAELVRRAKTEGISVTAEVTPHNLTLTEESLEGYNTDMKIYPPLRTSEDVAAVRAALKAGTIDCVATDHAPHTAEDKMQEFDHAPFGTIGLETAFAVVLTELYHGEKWPLGEIVNVLSCVPAKILGLKAGFGRIRKGDVANLALADLDHEWVVSAQDFSSKSKNSCFLGRKLKGKIRATVCAGRLWEYPPA
ncbi:MAG: dihydroorotase [Candidatus Omnitrophota bacterium]